VDNKLLHLLTGEIGPEDIDTSKFMLSATCIVGLRNIRLKSSIEILQLHPQQFKSAEDFANKYSTKSYEVTFIDYLISLSETNVELANDKSLKHTEE
jgi:hypothetical protein